MSLGRAVAVVIPAKDEERRIAATVLAAADIDGVDVVVVVDDGSSDRTSLVAEAAGARVVRHARNRGKAAAMETGAAAVSAYDLEHRDAGTEGATGAATSATAGRLLLFLDADLEGTARAAAPLIPPVRDGSTDMTIALLPVQSAAGGGHGLVVRLSRDGIARATGWTASQPLSGQRCLTPQAFAAARPLARGFGVETGLTIDLLRKGFRVTEVPCDLQHRVTGKDWRAQIHRARQYRDVARALIQRRALGPRRQARVR